MNEIFGNNLSFPSNKVRYTANISGFEYKFVTINLMQGEQKNGAFIQMNPVGKVPVLKQGSFCLFESNSICRYIAKSCSSSLVPSDIKGQALVDQWMEFISHHIGNAIGKQMFNTHFYKIMNIEKDQRSLDESSQWLENYLGIMDEQYKSKDFLVGDCTTLADISLLATIEPLEVLDFETAKFVNVCRVIASLKSQDFYKSVHNCYRDSFEQVAAAA